LEKKEAKYNLPTLDDLFSTQEERTEAVLKKIQEIPLSEIDDFPDHPFKVKDDEDMYALADSIKEYGVLTPGTVRKKEDGRFELLSGHRRKRACEIAGVTTLRAEVVEMDRDAAVIFMVDSNLQRTTILPSEKAFSYKMRLDAMKRQGQRTDLTSTPVVQKLPGNYSVDILGKDVGESREQIRRYIRLTELIPEILELVDEGKIALRPAVEISYLPDTLQYSLLEAIELEDCTPSHDQAIRMRKSNDANTLNKSAIFEIMQEEKPNQRDKLVIRGDAVTRLFPKNLAPAKREAYIIKALEHYAKHLERVNREHER